VVVLGLEWPRILEIVNSGVPSIKSVLARVRRSEWIAFRFFLVRPAYVMYFLSAEDTAALVGSDIRWVGIGIVNDTVYAIGHAADKKQTEGSGYTALYQIDNG